jgi:hypothetical protein
MNMKVADVAICSLQGQVENSPSRKNVFEFDPLQDHRWSELVKKHPNSSVFHTTKWLSALCATYGYEPVVYTPCHPASELTSGIVFCKVKSWLTGCRLVSLPFSDHCSPLIDSDAELESVLSSICDEVETGNIEYCEVRPARFSRGMSSRLKPSDRYVWHVVDLEPTTDEIFRNFHKSAQRKIQRAERENLGYEEGNSEELLHKFYSLLVKTRKRQGLPPQPLKWFRSLMGSFGEDLKIRIALKNQKPIASIVTLDHKDTVTYKYGCSDAQYHPLGGMALLFWNTIQQAKASGFRRLDLGRGEIGNEGLSTYKEHWGGIRSDLCYWRHPNRLRFDESRWKKSIAERMVRLSPDRLLVVLGEILYRHVG